MKSLLLTGAAFVALLFSSCVAASNVVDLDPSNFDKVIDGSKPALVEFFAPWCGHCKSLAPVYEELGDALASYKDKIVIAKVDADKNRDLGSRFGVKGFPTLKWFPAGSTKPEDYSGGRSLEDFLGYISGKTGIKSVIKKPQTFVNELSSSSLAEELKDPSKNLLVEFYAPWCGHCKNLAPIYEKVAKDFATESNCVVANVDATVHTDLGEKYGVSGYPTIKFFPAGSNGENPSDYEGGRTEEDFVKFLNEKCGTKRTVGGRLNDEAGRIPALDALVSKLYTASDSQSVIAEATKIAAESKESTAKYYIKVFEKAAKAGKEYVTKESARLEKILNGGTTTLEKADNFVLRLNVLRAFSEGATPKAEESVREEL